MKIAIFLLAITITSICHAQSIPTDILSTLESTINIGASSPGMAEAAIINAQGNFLLKSSVANINNQKAYGLSINNNVLRASAYFEKQQINLYNRTLQEFQRKNIAYLRKNKIYSKEELDNMFDIRYKTGYIIP